MYMYFMSNPKNCSTLYIMVQLSNFKVLKPSWNFENQFDVGIAQSMRQELLFF